MKLKSIITTALLMSGVFFLASCGGGVDKDAKPVDLQELSNKQPETHGTEIKASDITLSNPLNAEWITSGKSIYEMKCQACHRLNEERVVGPGWKDVTKRRQPLWIMNMIVNVEMMLETDPEAQRQLELCLVRMPNQNVSKDEARQILEFMRSNDGEK